jgi:rod shape-determining protein MreB
MFTANDLAIDLGTANTCMFALGRGLLLNEPSVIAVNTLTRGVEAVGEVARDMIGRTPENIDAIRPLRDGVIADYDAAEKMLSIFIKRIQHWLDWRRARVVVGVPAGSTPVEKRAVRDSVHRARAREVYLVEQTMAAAVGAGLPIHEPAGNMVVDIGAGTTDIAVISMSGVVLSRSLRVAGNHMDAAIIQYLKRRHNLHIGERLAEQIKIEIGSGDPLFQPVYMEVKGIDVKEGRLRSVELSDADIREALSEPVRAIITAVRRVLDRVPPELSADLFDRGILLTGGGALLKNLDTRLRRETSLPVVLAEEPLAMVALGAGKMLSDVDLLKRIAAE